MAKIIVTGGAGFIGSAVVRLAISREIEVVNVDSLTYAACLSNLQMIDASPLYTFEHADIRNRAALREAFDRHRPDAIVHLAAESHVDRSIEGPLEFIDTNVVGTATLLNVARDYWVGRDRPSDFRFLHVSTDEVFGSLGKEGHFSESTPYSPNSPYSASKAASDHIVRAWGMTYGVPTIVTNCSNNFGPYQFPEKLVPVVILNAVRGLPIPIYGDGLNVRDWLYVEDHAEALLKVLTFGRAGRTYNIGGDCELRNIDIARMICDILDVLRPNPTPYSEQITFVNDRPGHDFRYAVSTARIRAEIGWQPQTTFDDRIRKTVAWYLANETWWRTILDRRWPRSAVQP